MIVELSASFSLRNPLKSSFTSSAALRLATGVGVIVTVDAVVTTVVCSTSCLVTMTVEYTSVVVLYMVSVHSFEDFGSATHVTGVVSTVAVTTGYAMKS